MSTSHAADLELARRCADGDESAWERFVLEYRPVLYRAADALDPAGGARELADALYADLYGVRHSEGRRHSLLLSFQGRSSLATWLRAVLAQRYVDRLRARRRFDALPEDDSVPLRSRDARPVDGRGDPPDVDRPRYLALVRDALGRAVGALASTDRLRLGCYYAQGLTLAETGRLLGEHEATVSRKLARTRRSLRADVERRLRDEARLNDRQMAECFASAAEEVGALDLGEWLGGPGEDGQVTPGKKPVRERSLLVRRS